MLVEYDVIPTTLVPSNRVRNRSKAVGNATQAPMHSNEFLESKLDELANTPTATDLEYEDSDLDTIVETQSRVIECRPDTSPESTTAWLRIDTRNFIFNLEEWR